MELLGILIKLHQNNRGRDSYIVPYSIETLLTFGGCKTGAQQRDQLYSESIRV